MLLQAMFCMIEALSRSMDSQDPSMTHEKGRASMRRGMEASDRPATQFGVPLTWDSLVDHENTVTARALAVGIGRWVMSLDHPSRTWQGAQVQSALKATRTASQISDDASLHPQLLIHEVCNAQPLNDLDGKNYERSDIGSTSDMAGSVNGFVSACDRASSSYDASVPSDDEDSMTFNFGQMIESFVRCTLSCAVVVDRSLPRQSKHTRGADHINEAAYDDDKVRTKAWHLRLNSSREAASLIQGDV